MYESPSPGSLHAWRPCDWGDEDKIGARLIAALRALEQGKSGVVQGKLSSSELSLLRRCGVRDAVRRTVQMFGVGETDTSASVPALGYTEGISRGDYYDLDWELAAIPGPSEAATADPSFILSGDDLHKISENFLLKREEERPSKRHLSRSRVHIGVKTGHYAQLLERMYRAGMVEFREPSSDVIENSIFGVWKVNGVSQLVIWAGNRSNQLFNVEASEVELPTPDLISSFRVPDGEELHIGGCDISQFYNRLRAPDFLVPYLGLPRIRSALVKSKHSSRYVVPCLRCIPMGATFAVALAQRVSI